MQAYINVLKKYAVFEGRARRQEYWMFILFNLIVAFIVGVVGGITRLPVLGPIYMLAVLIPGLAVCVRRLHDTNHSGWWIFLSLIPVAGNIVLLVFFLTDSNQGDNAYGPNPKVETRLSKDSSSLVN